MTTARDRDKDKKDDDKTKEPIGFGTEPTEPGEGADRPGETPAMTYGGAGTGSGPRLLEQAMEKAREGGSVQLVLNDDDKRECEATLREGSPYSDEEKEWARRLIRGEVVNTGPRDPGNVHRGVTTGRGRG